MKGIILRSTCLTIVVMAYALPVSAAAPLESRVNETFRSVFGRNPSATENTYWAERVVRKEKTTFEALQGAMYYQKAQGQAVGSASSSAKRTSSTAASRQQLIKDVLPLFIQIYGNDPSNAEKAWWRKRISCGEIKSEKVLVNSMKYHKSKKARLGSVAICGVAPAATLSGGIVRKQIAGLSSHPFGDQIRIGIFKADGKAIQVTADKKFQVREGADTVLATVKADDAVQISWSDGKYHVRGSDLSFDTTNKIRLVPLDQGIMKITSFSDLSATYPGKNYNRFRGIIEIRKCDGCSDLWAINELRVEYYLRGLAET